MDIKATGELGGNDGGSLPRIFETPYYCYWDCFQSRALVRIIITEFSQRPSLRLLLHILDPNPCDILFIRLCYFLQRTIFRIMLAYNVYIANRTRKGTDCSRSDRVFIEHFQRTAPANQSVHACVYLRPRAVSFSTPYSPNMSYRVAK